MRETEHFGLKLPDVDDFYNVEDQNENMEKIDAGLAAKADLDSPSLAGKPTAPTPKGGANDTQIANTAFVQAVAAEVIRTIAAGALSLGETSSTAYRGDRGKTAYDHSQSAHLGLGETASTAYAGNKGKALADAIGVLSGLTTSAKNTLVAAINELNTNMVDRIYPVGSIYMSVVATDPGALFGGEWIAWGSGRVPVGVDPADTDFNTAQKTGGDKIVALSVDNLPSHKHIIGAHSHGLNNHTHNVSITSGGMSANSTGEITNYAVQSSGTGVYAKGFACASKMTGSIGYAVNSKSGDNSSYSDTVSMNISHTHSISGNTGGASGSTANSTQFDSGSNGAGTAHNNLQPYITCYMWQRIA